MAAMLICALQYWFWRPSRTGGKPVSQNPLELGAAGILAAMFVLTSLLSTWVKTEFGLADIYSLAAIVGVTDIDPFVLNLAQGGTSGIPNGASCYSDRPIVQQPAQGRVCNLVCRRPSHDGERPGTHRPRNRGFRSGDCNKSVASRPMEMVAELGDYGTLRS
jgi:hypothetical protein